MTRKTKPGYGMAGHLPRPIPTPKPPPPRPRRDGEPGFVTSNPPPPEPPERPHGEVITEGCSKPKEWFSAEDAKMILASKLKNIESTIPNQSKLNSLKEFIMKAFKDLINFDKMWEAVQALGWAACVCFVAFYTLLALQTCQKQSNESSINELNLKNKAMQECIDKTQKVWECKESLK